MIILSSIKKIFECVALSAALFLSQLTFSAEINSNEKLAHLTGLLLTTPGNNEVARNLLVLSKEQLKKTQRSAETNELLRMSAQALNINKIQNTFDRCLKNKERAKARAGRIRDAAIAEKLKADPCRTIIENKNVSGLTKLSDQIDHYQEKVVKDLALSEGQKNFAKTYVYWDRRIKHDGKQTSLSEQCAELHCTQEEKSRLKTAEEEALKTLPANEQNKSPSEIAKFTDKQDQLLKYTNTLQNKKSISPDDVLKAQSEVKNLLADQLKKIRSMNLEDLVKTNPAAIGKVLLENPELTPVICRMINQIAEKEESKETWNKVYFWGGLIVGGTLLVTGVGAGVGAWVLGETALSATLVTVATATAVISSGVAAGETVYSSSKYLSEREEALALRASTISKNGDQQTGKEAEAKLNEAWSDLTSAGINAVGIIPFGPLWRFMRTSAKMSRVGSLAKIEQMSAQEEAAALKQLSATIKELNNPQLEKILINAKNKVSSEDYGFFIGQLSQLSKEQRELVIAKMIAHPEKVGEAMKKGAQAGREACK